jgi:hypothetical protein
MQTNSATKNHFKLAYRAPLHALVRPTFNLLNLLLSCFFLLFLAGPLLLSHLLLTGVDYFFCWIAKISQIVNATTGKALSASKSIALCWRWLKHPPQSVCDYTRVAKY